MKRIFPRKYNIAFGKDFPVKYNMLVVLLFEELGFSLLKVFQIYYYE